LDQLLCHNIEIPLKLASSAAKQAAEDLLLHKEQPMTATAHDDNTYRVLH